MTVLYKHKNCQDVAVEVLRKFYIKEKDAYSLKVEWWRVSRVNAAWPMGITQRLKIDRKTWLHEWPPYQQ